MTQDTKKKETQLDADVIKMYASKLKESASKFNWSEVNLLINKLFNELNT